jgi:hypothetical protein
MQWCLTINSVQNKKNKKSKYFFLAAAEKFPRFVLIAFFLTPLVTKRPKTRFKKKNAPNAKQPREKKKPHFFMSPDGFFRKKIIAFLNSPCHETPKNSIKKIDEKK